MEKRASRYALYLSGGRLEAVMFPAPPWMITRGLSFGLEN